METSWLYDNYENLVEEYGGSCVLIRDNKVIFADINSKIVLEYALKHYPDRKWEIARIDSGEAAFYDLRISDNQN